VRISFKRHGHDPLAYLHDVLTRLPSMTKQDDLRPLTPWHWDPTKLWGDIHLVLIASSH
jgi:hypothetical protein